MRPDPVPPSEPIVTRAARPIAAVLVPRVARFGRVSPTMVTTLWIVLLVPVGLLLSVGSVAAAWGALGLVMVVQVLDCLDGQLARATGRVSRIGGLLEGLGQWVATLAAVIGTIAAAQVSTAAAIVALSASATFHLVYLLVPPALSGPPPPAMVRLNRLVLPTMPLDLNLLVLAAAVGAPRAGLALWTAISLVLAAALVLLFLLAEGRSPSDRSTAGHQESIHNREGGP